MVQMRVGGTIIPKKCIWAIPCNYGHDSKNKSSYAEYLVFVLHCTHITCHGFKGNIQIQLNNYEISPFEQLCEKLQFFTLKITHSLAPIIMKYYIIWRTALDLLLV